MTSFSAVLRLGAYVGLLSSGAFVGIIFDRNRNSGKFFDKFNIKTLEGTDSKDEKKKAQKLIRGSEILKYGRPTPLVPEILFYENHVLSYDPQKRTPKWVAEHITRDHVDPLIEKMANRKFSKFRPDPVVPSKIRSTNDDFWDSGWSRGHLAPAGNNKHSQLAMNETFYLTNVVPQDFDNNGDFWNRLEIYCRDLTKKYSDVRIISGPLWLPDESRPTTDEKREVLINGRKKKAHKIMNYPVIGDNHVSVPTHLFKIVLAEDPSLSSPLLAAFVVPNKPIPRNFSLVDFKVDIEDIEASVGVRFHSELERSSTRDLCQVDGCQMMDYKSFQLFYIKRGIMGARTEAELARYWRKASDLELINAELEQLRSEAVRRISERISKPDRKEASSG